MALWMASGSGAQMNIFINFLILFQFVDLQFTLWKVIYLSKHFHFSHSIQVEVCRVNKRENHNLKIRTNSIVLLSFCYLKTPEIAYSKMIKENIFFLCRSFSSINIFPCLFLFVFLFRIPFSSLSK